MTVSIGALTQPIIGRSPFSIDVLDSSGGVIGAGPLATVMQMNDTDSLDKIGNATFSLPASDPACSLITAGCQFALRDRVDGYVGQFLYRSKRLTDSWGEPLLEVNCDSTLQELSRYTVGFRRVYDYDAVDVVVADLISLATGWSASVDAGIGNTTIPYEGESVLVAMDALRDRWGQHYRLSPPRMLQFGAFGVASGVRLTNLRGQVAAEIAAHTEIAIVSSISLVEEDAEVFNRIIPLGAGQGVSQLTIELATAGAYAVVSALNQDGTSYYYIESSASIASYGRRVRVLICPQFRPITNSVADILNAANALKLTAEAYIARHLTPKVTYDVEVVGLRQVIRPGDTVRLAYRGVVEGYTYIDIDQDFYVMDITRSRSIVGQRAARLTIASVAQRRTADSDVMIDVINDVRALKVHVPITLAYAPVGPYTKRIDSTHTAAFTVRIGSEVTALNYAIMRFRTAPLRSSSVTTTAGSAHSHGVTIGTGGAHSHSVTISAGGSHSHSVTISAGGSHSHSVTISAGGAHSHSVTISAGGSHSHDIDVQSGGSHSHAIDVQSGGSHSHGISAGGAHIHSISASGAHAHEIEIERNDHTVGVATVRVDLSEGYPAYFSINAAGGQIDVGSTTSKTHTHTETTSTTHTHTATAAQTHSHDAHATNAAGHSHAQTTAQSHSHDAHATNAAGHSHGAHGTNASAHSHGAHASNEVSHTHGAFASSAESHSHGAHATDAVAHSHGAVSSSLESAHSHGMVYGLYEDTSYPQTISITVDGVAVAGGPWAPAQAEAEEEIDITSLLLAGTLRMNHQIVFSCTTGQGEIEFECDMLVSVQAIQVT